MKNLISIEYLRAFCILYIVGYWHLFNYTNAFPQYNNPFTNEITNIILGLFVLISGFLAGNTEKIPTSPVYFYKKKLLRIYPLYALAVVIFYIYGINDAATSLKSLIFIPMYYGPAPTTLWFITMLLLFYLITPFLLELVETPVKFLLTTTIVFLITIALLITFKTVDHRILLYSPCFFTGIYCSKYGIKSKFVNIKSALILFFPGLLILLINFDSWTLNQLKQIPIIISSSYLVLAFSYINENKFIHLKIVSLLSYSSYAMYLFHRPIYSSLKELYFPVSEQSQVFYLMTFCLLMVATFSWGLQKTYDTIYMIFNKKVASRFPCQ